MGSVFRKYLLESPVAVIDDWGGFKSRDLRIGKKGIEIDWEFQDEIKDRYNRDVEIYKSENKYILGAWGA